MDTKRGGDVARKIGEVFEFEGKKYEVVEAPNTNFCDGCIREKELECFFGNTGSCSPRNRKDRESVIFAEVEE